VNGDRVSWFVIEPGWTVVDAEGKEVGAVDEVVGDSSDDIFNGLAISTGVLGRPRYVPAEQVETITDGRIRLTLTKAEVGELREYKEPPTSAEVLPDEASLKDRIEQPIEAPIHERPFTMNVWRRLWFRLRRRRH
jgi:hypothetical protein